MRLTLLFCLALVSASNLERRLDLFNAALSSLTTSVTDLEQSLVGAVILYPNRRTCPRGFVPAHHLDGKFPVVGNLEVGRVSSHSLHDEIEYNLTAKCEHKITVSEDGFVDLCGHPTTSSINMKEAVPSFSVLACLRANVVYSPP